MKKGEALIKFQVLHWNKLISPEMEWMIQVLHWNKLASPRWNEYGHKIVNYSTCKQLHRYTQKCYGDGTDDNERNEVDLTGATEQLRGRAPVSPKQLRGKAPVSPEQLRGKSLVIPATMWERAPTNTWAWKKLVWAPDSVIKIPSWSRNKGKKNRQILEGTLSLL